METLFDIGLRNAVFATLLALLAWVVGKAVRRPALTHVLWVLVLLRLVVPPVWNIAVPRPAWYSMPATAKVIAESIPSSEPSRPASNSEPDVAAATITPQPPSTKASPETIPVPALAEAPAIATEVATLPLVAPAPGEDAEPNANENTRRSFWLAVGAWPWKAIAAGIWLFGTLTVFGIGAVRVIRFGWAMRKAMPAPIELEREVAELARKMGLARHPSVLLMAGRISPLLWGFCGKPRLVLPVHLWQKLDADKGAALLVHELAHYGRGDHWVRPLEWLAGAVFWWHPVMWLARANLREAEEQCCDAWVIWVLPEYRREYATAIVDTLDFLAESRPVLPALASGVGTVRNLRRRLTMILREDTPRRLPRLALLGLLGLGVAMLAFGTSWADDPPRGGDRDRGRPERKDPPPADRRPDGDDREKLQAELQRARMAAEEARQNLEQAMRRLQELEQRLGGRGGDVRGGGRAIPPGGGDNAPGAPAGTPPAHRFAPGAPSANLPGQPGQPPAGMMPPGGRGMPGMGGMGMPGMPGGMPNIEQRLANLEKAVQDMSQMLQEMQRNMRNPNGGRGGPGGPGGQRPGEGGRGERLGDRPPGPGGAPTPPPPERERQPERE